MSQRITSRSNIIISKKLLIETLNRLEIPFETFSKGIKILDGMHYEFEKSYAYEVIIDHILIDLPTIIENSKLDIYKYSSAKDAFRAIAKHYRETEERNKAEKERARKAFVEESKEEFIKAAEELNYMVEEEENVNGEIILKLVRRTYT